MNYIYKVVTLLTVLSCSNSALLAHKFTFTNRTYGKVTLRFKLLGDTSWFEHIIASGQKAESDFPETDKKLDVLGNARDYFCLEKIQITQQIETGMVSNSEPTYTTDWVTMPINFIKPDAYNKLMAFAGSRQKFKIEPFVTTQPQSLCQNLEFDIINDATGMKILSKAK